MNAKEKSLNRLYKARVAHLKWVNTIKLLVSGLKVDKSHLTLPIIQDSEVGTWYYNEAIQFSQFRSQSVLAEMETLLEAMFNMYAKIYEIYFTEKQSTLKSFLGLKNTTALNRHEIELAGRYYEDIVKLSDEFKSKLHTLERQMLAMQENEHQLVTHFEEEEIVLQPKKKVKVVEEEVEEAVYSLRAR